MKILVLAGAILLLAGCGAGAYFYFSNSAQAAASADGEVEEEHAAKEEKSDGGHGGGHGALALFVELDPLILPVIDSEGVTQTVSVVVALEVADEATKIEVETLSPKLKDAYIQDMYGMLNEHAALKGGVIQVGYLKSRLNKITLKVLGQGKVSDVLLQVVQQRPI